MKPSDFPVISVTQGMSGYFAVMYWWNPEMGGFPEPYETGFGRYPDRASAIVEAVQWAKDENIKLDPALVAEAHQSAAAVSSAVSPALNDNFDDAFDMVAGQTNPFEDIP